MIKRYSVLAWSAIILATAFFITSCTEDTGSLGVYPQQDAISSSEATFDIISSSIANNNVPASSTACYLGKVIDPETDKTITATFATQFHTFENYAFPDEASIVKTDDGHFCESIEIRLFLNSTFGDKDNPMKIEVLPLSMKEDKLLKESEKLYTNTDLASLYVDEGQEPIATKVFTATDYIMTDAERASTNYSNNLRIVLDQSIGDNIMQKYYERAALPQESSYFKDSYTFIRNVCPGFLFRPVSGIGTMLNLEVCTMNLHFNYKSSIYPDSTISALCRFAATPEVIQSTQFESSDLTELIEAANKSNTTMLKTPAGICTELVLPIDDIYRGHESDSISLASVTIQRLNNQDEDAKDDDYALGIPRSLLLVRKQKLKSFFENHQVSDSQQSYTTQFSSIFNSYTFANLSQLISYCQNEKIAGMKATGKTAEEWEADHPDWNRVVLVPVTVATATDSYGTTTQVSVTQDMSLCSTKLVRGTADNPIKMQVIYSRFAGN